ncbi:MAG: hypothetical protein JST24_01605 [Acidobacteria bacterium]|nr:hypothetical protein [Acidobacteriota bacterium]
MPKVSHSPEPDSLQAPPSDKWWAILSLGLLAALSIWAGVVCYRLLKVPPPAVAVVDHGPIPAEIRAKAMAILNADLKDARLEERWQGEDRDFFVMGTPRPEFAKPFTDEFKADMVDKLFPLLRPYGESVSFQIYNFDFAPVRLRPLPEKPKD